jgi:hypothetical protein
MMWSAAIGGGVATKMWYDEVNDYVKIYKDYANGDFHMKTGRRKNLLNESVEILAGYRSLQSSSLERFKVLGRRRRLLQRRQCDCRRQLLAARQFHG